MNNFLPTSKEEMIDRGWDELDVILVTGDSYVDHPSYGAAIIGRVLEKVGYRVGIIPQPDWKQIDDFIRLGRPRLFFGVTAGNLDSMVAHYTANKKRRNRDEYSPAARSGLRPDRATIVYANRIREAFKETVIVIGGIEASLRRFAHYDWWDNDVRRSILLDARADILVYGMGEKQVVEIARRMKAGENLAGIRGTSVIRKDPLPFGEFLEIPSYEATRGDHDLFNRAFTTIYRNHDPFRGKVIAQRHGDRYVIQFPPPHPLSTAELDSIYALPFVRRPHPACEKEGPIPGFKTVRFSIISHRGCCGECSFCSLSVHQGRIIQSRSAQSILAEAANLTEQGDFKGTITDVGGPTANLYGARCPSWTGRGTCPDKRCLTPERCNNLSLGYKKGLALLRDMMKLPGVSHVFIESGIRYDLLTDDRASHYLEQVCRYHVSGQMKVAPEHSVRHVLKLMNKPDFEVYETFVRKFNDTNRRIGKKQYLVNYFISAHPGCTLADTLDLSLSLMKRGIHPEQIQDFIPLPMTVSGSMYHTEKNPFTGEPISVAKTIHERKMHRALLQYWNPSNRRYVQEALKRLRRRDLLKSFLGKPVKTMTKTTEI